VEQSAGGVLSGKKLGLAVTAWLGASAVAGGITVATLRWLAPAAASDPAVLSPLIVAEVYALLIAALAVVLRPAFREAVAWKRFTAADVALAAAACAAAYVIIGGVEALLAPRQWTATVSVLTAIGSDDGRLATAGPARSAVIFLRACLLAPLGEELLFRGALHTWLRRRLSARATVPITAAAFAAIHGYPALIPLAFVIGLGLGAVRERSGSTVPGVIAHVVNNVALTALSYALTGWTARLPVWGS
jgi:membrane protease YdiL (CAAX protease family)